MRILPASTGLPEALSILSSGGVIAHATETCYGFACDLTNPKAVEKLFAIKQRPATQPVSALFPSVEEAKNYVEWNEKAEELAKQYLPGPLTLILPLRSDAPFQLFPIPLTADKLIMNNYQLKISVGVRISSHPLAQQLVTAFGKPLSTSSANIHGQPNPYSAIDIKNQFTGQKFQPDLILDSGTLPPTPPSTVINLTESGNTGILRQGNVKM